MCIENTGFGKYLLIFTKYLNNNFNSSNSYEYNKKNDIKNECIIDMEPIPTSMNNSREIGTQTEGILEQEINWEVICDSN
tara:strand:- start:8399 stop:8638 length:240 start_codon:yes stop_codon:yes gene_type:complete